jgi:hypothetical protein
MYIYGADCWCDKCGAAIRARLTAEGKAPADPACEASYDSGDFPKVGGSDEDHGETDSPTHCAAGEDCLEAVEFSPTHKVGKLLGTNLTAEGERYTREYIRQGGTVADYWAEEFRTAGYDWPEFGMWGTLYRAARECLPDLARFCAKQGPGPDKRLQALREALEAAGQELASD